MKRSSVLAGLSFVTGLAVIASGMSSAQDVIAKRREYMKAVGAATKASNEMIKGEKPYDAAAAADAMNKISAGWADYAKSYPKGTETGGETTAAPKIWETPQDFNEKGEAMAKAAKHAAAEAGKGVEAFKAAFGAVTTCKGCHEVYRIQKK